MSTDLCHLLLTQHSPLFPPHLLHVDQTSSSPSPNLFFPTIQLSISIHNPPTWISHPIPLRPSVLLHFSGSMGAHVTISFPASPFFFSPSSISSCLAFPLPVFLLPRTSWENITQAFRDQKALLAFSLRPSLLQSFSVGFSKGQWLQPSDAASAMPINVGGLKTEQGERGKKSAHAHISIHYHTKQAGGVSQSNW